MTMNVMQPKRAPLPLSTERGNAKEDKLLPWKTFFIFRVLLHMRWLDGNKPLIVSQQNRPESRRIELSHPQAESSRIEKNQVDMGS